MRLVQCWDDGVTTDVRLVALLRRHGARATFNLSAGLHTPERRFGWSRRDTGVWRLGLDELREVCQDFGMANHTLTHPRLDRMPIDAARAEIVDGRARLQALFEQPVRGYACPYGSFDAAVAQAVRDAGHAYARTTQVAEAGMEATDTMAMAPSCHFLAPDFWQRCDRARPGGVVWFWGHSCAPEAPVADSVYGGVLAVMRALHARKPAARLLLQSILPTSEPARDEAVVRPVNQRLAALAAARGAKR